MDILNFIFSSFWTWSGTVVLVGVSGGAAVGLVKAVMTPFRVKRG